MLRLQGRQSGLKTGCVVGPGLKIEGVAGPKIQPTGTHSTGLRVHLARKSLFSYRQILLFMKSHHFEKCSHLIFL